MPPKQKKQRAAALPEPHEVDAGELARQHSLEAVRVLVEAMRQEDDLVAKVAAANGLLAEAGRRTLH